MCVAPEKKSKHTHRYTPPYTRTHARSKIVLNKCPHELAAVLLKLYKYCPVASCFPSYWKSFSVVHLYKNFGEYSDTTNYRPVSQLRLFSKIFKTLINAELLKQHTYRDKQNIEKVFSCFSRGGVNCSAEHLTLFYFF